ncbi:MAG: hypothetical protein AAGC71_09285 [Pseudomonadota bacterium]
MFVVCAALQLALLPALVLFAGAIAAAIQVLPSGDPERIAGEFSSGVVSSVMFVLPALVGVIVSWFMIRTSAQIPTWFARVTYLLSWCWLVYLPLGTLFGAIQLVLLRHARRQGRIATVRTTS